MTKATEFAARQYVVEFAVPYPVMALGQKVFEAYGVDGVWGTVVYLIDKDGKIVARGLKDTKKALDS